MEHYNASVNVEQSAPGRECTTCDDYTIKGEGSPYSITERRVPELIPFLGSRPAGDVSHKPGGRQACSYPRNS